MKNQGVFRKIPEKRKVTPMLKKLIALFRKSKSEPVKAAVPVRCVQMQLPLDF